MKCKNCGGTGQRVMELNANEHCEGCGEFILVNKWRYIQRVQLQTHDWRMEKWPDLTPLAQLAGTDVEVSELLEMEVKGEHYDEAWANEEQFKEEIGDVILYLMGYASLRDLDIVECIEAALDKNKNRNWKDHMEAPTEEDL